MPKRVLFTVAGLENAYLYRLPTPLRRDGWAIEEAGVEVAGGFQLGTGNRMST